MTFISYYHSFIFYSLVLPSSASVFLSPSISLRSFFSSLPLTFWRVLRRLLVWPFFVFFVVSFMIRFSSQRQLWKILLAIVHKTSISGSWQAKIDRGKFNVRIILWFIMYDTYLCNSQYCVLRNLKRANINIFTGGKQSTVCAQNTSKNYTCSSKLSSFCWIGWKAI